MKIGNNLHSAVRRRTKRLSWFEFPQLVSEMSLEKRRRNLIQENWRGSNNEANFIVHGLIKDMQKRKLGDLET